MGVVVNRDPTAHTFSIISSSAYPAAYWGTITPPPPHVTGGTVRFATHDLAVGVKSQLNALEYQRVAALRSLNTNFAPHKFWMPLNTYSIQDNGPQGSGAHDPGRRGRESRDLCSSGDGCCDASRRG